MGGADFSIYPDEVEAQAPAFERSSTDLQQALAALTSALNNLGAPWGADEQGQKFASAYTPQHDALLKSFGTLVEGLSSIYDGLTAHAANHQTTDAHNATQLRAK